MYFIEAIQTSLCNHWFQDYMLDYHVKVLSYVESNCSFIEITVSRNAEVSENAYKFSIVLHPKVKTPE